LTIFARVDAFYERRRTAVILGGIGAFYLIVNLVWLARDTLPPAWDQAAHADHCLSYLRLFSAPASLSLTKLLPVSSYYPPFFYLVTVPASALFGFSYDVLAATHIVFLLVLAFAVLKIGERLFGFCAGAGAAVLVALYPAVYGLSREVLLDFPVLAMVALSQYVILAGKAGTSLKRGALLGLVLGLSVMTKWTAVAFLPGTFLVVFGEEFAKGNRTSRRKLLASLAIALCVFLAVVLPWLLANRPGFIKTASAALYEDSLIQGDPTEVAASVAYYGRALWKALVSPIIATFTLLGVAAFGFGVRKGKAAAFLAAWALPAFLVFLLVPNKDGRNIVPLLPALALFAASGLDTLRPMLLKRAAWGLIVLAGTVQFFAFSFGSPPGLKNGYARPPRNEDWKAGEILRFLADRRPGRPLRVAFLPDLPYFNFSTFRFTAHLANLPFVVDPVGTGPGTFEALGGYDALITKSGPLAVRFTLKERAAFRERFNASLKRRARTGLPFRPWKTFRLPDGSKARLFARISGK
jgi:4-amino-4-deoxy-L-arabinose transferase-like glycosyltransferase